MLLCPKCNSPMKPLFVSAYCPKCEGGEKAPAATAEKYAIGMTLIAKADVQWCDAGEEVEIMFRSEVPNGEGSWEVRTPDGSRFRVLDWAMPKYFNVKGS